MKEISRMRLGVLRELKNLRKFLDAIERNVKSRNSESIEKSYIFLCHLVYMMNHGILSPKSIALDVELAKELQNPIQDN